MSGSPPNGYAAWRPRRPSQPARSRLLELRTWSADWTAGPDEIVGASARLPPVSSDELPRTSTRRRRPVAAEDVTDVPADVRERHARARRGGPRPPVPLLRAGLADDLRRRVRQAAAASCRRSRTPSRPGHAGFADAAGRAARSRPSSPRSTTSSECSAWTTSFDAEELVAWLERVEKEVGDDRVPVRAQDRRPGDQPALRERPPDPGADPRRRPHRRGRHARTSARWSTCRRR